MVLIFGVFGPIFGAFWAISSHFQEDYGHIWAFFSIFLEFLGDLRLFCWQFLPINRGVLVIMGSCQWIFGIFG